jgi:acetyltransferase-like isoleucine patch superfamily enzyme
MPEGQRLHPFIPLIRQLERARGTVHLPTGSVLGGALFYGRPLLSNLRSLLMQILIYEPALRYRCHSLGRKLRLMGPAPRISGDGIIDIGVDVEFAGEASWFVGMGLPEPAHLEIKDHVAFTGPHILTVARSVSIGSYCWIGPGVAIYDNDNHPLDAAQRRVRLGPVQFIKSAPVVLEDDVWLGLNAIVLKGVTLHRGAVVGAGAVVTESVPPYTAVAGNPARVVRQLSESGSVDERVTALVGC